MSITNSPGTPGNVQNSPNSQNISYNYGAMSAAMEAAALLANAAAIAVAVYNTMAAIEIADKQYEIAKGYLDIARELHDYWLNTFKPCEQAYVAEACAAPVYQPRYEETAGRYVASVRQQFRKSIDNVVRTSSRYCTGLTAAMMKDIAIAEAQAVGSARNFAYRYEEARKERKDDIRWSRRHNALGLGRGLLGEAAQYGQAAGKILGDLGGQAVAGANGAMQFLGNQLNRNQTAYPQRGVGTQAPAPVENRTITGNMSVEQFVNPSVNTFGQTVMAPTSSPNILMSPINPE
jgi:hypothetical protein